MPEVEETDPQPDLVWDDQVRSLCVRIYGDDVEEDGGRNAAKGF